jgi:serine protease DegS
MGLLVTVTLFMFGKPTLGDLFWPVVTGILLAIIILLLYPAQFGLERPQEGDAGHANGATTSYAEAVQRATPSVVNIYTSTVVQREVHPLFNDPLLRHFLDQGNNPRQQRLQQSLGSGVIVDSRGYILTNNHVIAGADQILVSLYDRRESLATVIGTDPDTDLAVLKIELEGIEAISFGSSADVRVGDIVLAIGNPFGFGQTVTQGIISATGRYGLNLNTYEDYLQTDADINPGNSGGALINPRGELVGINAAIFSRSGGSQGIGLAIPAENAREVLDSIVDHGRVIRGWLGLEVAELTPQAIAQLALPLSRGIIITATHPQGPADRAGLRVGDVIVAINDSDIMEGREGLLQVARMMPGEPAAITVLRNGTKLTLNATVGTRPTPLPR